MIAFEFVIKTINLIFSICIYIVVRLFSMYFVASFCDGKGCNFSKYIRPKSYTNWLGVRIPNALLSSIPIFSAASPLQCTKLHFEKKNVQSLLSAYIICQKLQSWIKIVKANPILFGWFWTISKTDQTFHFRDAFLLMLLLGWSLTVILKPRGAWVLQTFQFSRPVLS